jgi:hypothetical protein
VASGYEQKVRRVYCGLPSVILFLRDDAYTGLAPATIRLTSLKGPSDASRRGPHHLRSQIGAINKIFGSLHCPDEPIDALRELAILFEGRALRELLRRVDAFFDEPEPFDVSPVLAEIYSAVPEHHIDVDAAIARVLASLPAAAAGHSGQAEWIQAIARGEAPLDCRQLAQDAAAPGPGSARVGPPALASHYVQYDRPGATKLIESLSTTGCGNTPPASGAFS